MSASEIRIRGSRLLNLLLLGLCCFVIVTHSLASPSLSERLVYNVYWLGIKAGTATLSIENTPDGIVITSRARSAPFVSIFYEVDDFAQSILYPDGYPSKYILKIREGRHRRDKVILFGIKPEKGPQKVIYNNRLENETVEFDLERRAFDPLSAAYAISRRYLQVGRSEYIDIFDGKKLWNTEIQVLRKERIRVPAGEFDTIVIRPILKSEGIFMKKGEIYIWLTDDDRKIPVMLKSKVKVGSFKAKLVEDIY